MDRPPSPAQIAQRDLQFVSHQIDLTQTKSITFPQAWRPIGTIENKHSLTASTENVHMSRAMIVRIYDHAEATNSMNGRHSSILE